MASGYKWLGGHGGVAIAAVAASMLDEPPLLPGWMGAPEPFAFDATHLATADDARRFTQSTMSYASLAGLSIAIDALLATGLDAIEAHARGLATQLLGELEPRGWRPFRELSDPGASSHIVSLAREDQDIDATVGALRETSVVCSARGGRVRVSIAPYNDESDIERLVAALG